MARVLEQMRAGHESRILSEVEEQEESIDKPTTSSSSSHTKVLPHQKESQAFGALSPLENYEINTEGQAGGRAESRNQSGDIAPLEKNTSIEIVPLTPEGSIVPYNQDLHTEVNLEAQVENTTAGHPEVGSTVPEKENAASPPPIEIRTDESAAEKKINKLSRTYKRLKKMVNHLTKQLKQENKAWNPKKELTTVETQTKPSPNLVDTAEARIQTNPADTAKAVI